jgi:hypothetical protein
VSDGTSGVGPGFGEEHRVDVELSERRFDEVTA